MSAPLATWILEAAFRSLVMALAVWAGIRLLRVRGARAQRAAWALVLLAAALMPLAMRLRWLTVNRLGLEPVNLSLPAQATIANQQESTSASEPVSVQITRDIQAASASYLPKPRVAWTPHTALSQPDNRTGYRASFPTKFGPATAPNPPANMRPRLAENLTAAHPALLNWDRIRSFAALAYLGGATLLMFRIALGLAIAFRFWRRATPLPLGLWSGSDAMHVRISPDLATPVTIGSTVILPSGFAAWDDAKLRIVLAHEGAHIRQRDFYLQLIAALYAAAFWFSPLGWWLQRRLSELGETLSDRAGLAQAPNPAAYARILLEFAAQPRGSMFHNFIAGPLTGVPMARSSRLSTRIERILNPHRFRWAELGSRRHALLAAALVPIALAAAVAGIRIVPAVEAARQTQAPAAIPVPPAAGQVSPSAPDQVTSIDTPQSQNAATIAPPVPPAAPVPSAPPAPNPGFAFSFSDSQEGGQDSFAIVGGDGNSSVWLNGRNGAALEEAKRKYRGNFLWFERGGKSYVVTDPATVAEAEALLRSNQPLQLEQAELARQQAKLQAEMVALQPEIDRARLPGPEFEAQMAKLQHELADMHLEKLPAGMDLKFSAEEQAKWNRMAADLAAQAVKSNLDAPEFQAKLGKLQAELGQLQSDSIKRFSEQIDKAVRENGKLSESEIRELTEKQIEAAQDRLGDLQSKIGDIQGRIGDIQGEIGEQMGRIGEKQGEIGEKMGKIGEEMGKIGEAQGKAAEEAARKVQSLIDRALKDGRATPVK